MAAVKAFFTTSTPGRAFVTTPRKLGFFTTSSPLRAFVTTPRRLAFFTTSKPNKAFFTTLDEAATVLIDLQPGVTVMADDCSAVTIQDNTGIYSVDNPGGYNPQATASDPLRPKRSEVDIWVFLKYWRSDGTFVTYAPDTQNTTPTSDPTTWSLTVPLTGGDRIIEIVFVAVPTGTTYDKAAIEQQTVEYFIEWAAQKPGYFVGDSGILKGCSVLACYNEAEVRFCQAYMAQNDKCDYTEMIDLDSDLTALYSALVNRNYQLAAEYLESMTEYCADDTKRCNCGC